MGTTGEAGAGYRNTSGRQPMDTIGEWGRATWALALVGSNPWILLESGGGATEYRGTSVVGGDTWALLESGGGATGALVEGNPWILLESGRGYGPSSRVVGTSVSF